MGRSWVEYFSGESSSGAISADLARGARSASLLDVTSRAGSLGETTRGRHTNGITGLSAAKARFPECLGSAIANKTLLGCPEHPELEGQAEGLQQQRALLLLSPAVIWGRGAMEPQNLLNLHHGALPGLKQGPGCSARSSRAN